MGKRTTDKKEKTNSKSELKIEGDRLQENSDK
jgi:hypothetical protein